MDTFLYTVRPGNTLFAIAQFFGTTVQELQMLNGINDPNMIYTGQVLKIPEYRVTPSVYVVRPGDTLWSISMRYGTTVEKLLQYNALQNPNVIYPGQIIRIPG